MSLKIQQKRIRWCVNTIDEAILVLNDIAEEFLAAKTTQGLQLGLTNDVEFIKVFGVTAWQDEKSIEIARRDAFIEWRTLESLDAIGLDVPIDWLDHLKQHHFHILTNVLRTLSTR